MAKLILGAFERTRFSRFGFATSYNTAPPVPPQGTDSVDGGSASVQGADSVDSGSASVQGADSVEGGSSA
jgi:hypothetical protein